MPPTLLQPETERDTEKPLAGKTCLVTGGSRGIGRAIAEELGQAGGTVVVNYRSSDAAAREVVAGIESAGEEAMVAQADVADPDAVAAMAERVHGTVGTVDVLVNNAGITRDCTFEDMTREEWDRVIDVNLGGVFNTTRAFFEDLKGADGGRLVNISSVVGQQGNYGQANYAAAKCGLFGFTRTLALELAPHGTTANCVAPGFTETDMLDPVPERVKEKIRDRIPLDRFATPEEVAATVRFLATDDASYMTGQVLGVNGGMDW